MKKQTVHIYLSTLALAGTLLLGGAGALHAKNDDDLLRYSLLNPSGSPRFTAMGGAFGALGANFSAITVNPAGMGLYSRSETSLSGSITSGNGVADYYGETHRDNETKVNLPEASTLWLLYNKDEGKGLKRVQMGIGVNRLNDYTGAYLVSGFNPQSSYMEAVAAENYGALVPDEYGDGTLNATGGLAYNAYLLDGPDALGNFSTFLAGGNLNQFKRWFTNGNISELAIAFSGNVADKVYIGMNFGIPFVHYYYRSTLGESAAAGTRYPYDFRSYELGERLSVSGAGFTFKIGVMYQALDYLRIGAWFHTPTYYALNEDYTVDFSASMMWPTDDDGNPLPGSPSGETRSEYKYNIQTPLRAGAALGFIIGQYGVVDVEGEIVNYNDMQLRINDDWRYEQQVNQLVKDKYQVGGVLRVGTEWRAGIGRFRAGYVFNSSPYRDKTNAQGWANHTFSAGVGVAFGRWAIDFAVAYYLQKENYYLYNIVDAQTYAPLVQPARLTQNKLVYNLGFSVKI
ncbi:MAG: hypothetical protein K2I68_05330 [Bacteroidales bacterium]|nr:hypothetical protein [Bacteroidales bacterium]